MGLAPIVVSELFDALQQLVDGGVSILMVEQYVTKAIEMADVVYLMKQGEISFTGGARDVDEDAVMSTYLGVSETTATHED
jgi:branched-chain amino acid transport system ATP-binding protein